MDCLPVKICAEIKQRAIEEAVQCASSFARRARFWWFDQEDLTNEAVVEVLQALERWDPEIGDIGPYAGRVAMWACIDYVMRMGSPVGRTSKRRNGSVFPRRDGCPLSIVDDAPSPENSIGKEQWIVRVREAIDRLGGVCPEVNRVMQGEFATDVALQYGITKWNLYYRIRRVKERLSKDKDIVGLKNQMLL